MNRAHEAKDSVAESHSPAENAALDEAVWQKWMNKNKEEADPDTLDRPPVVFGWCYCLATNDEHVEVASQILCGMPSKSSGGDLLGDLFRIVQRLFSLAKFRELTRFQLTTTKSAIWGNRGEWI